MPETHYASGVPVPAVLRLRHARNQPRFIPYPKSASANPSPSPGQHALHTTIVITPVAIEPFGIHHLVRRPLPHRFSLSIRRPPRRSMQPRGDADDPPTVGPSRRRGLGFFPEPVVIRSDPYPGGDELDASDNRLRPSRGAPNRVPQSYSSWEEWKAWNTGHASTFSHKPPPVFVRPDVVKTGFEQGEEEGFGVDVENEGEEDTKTAPIHDAGKMPGSDLANWYRNLATGTAKDRDEVKREPDAPDLELAAPSTTQLENTAVDVKPDTKPSPLPLPSPPTSHNEISAENHPQPSVTSSASQSGSSTPAAAAPAPLRIPASEWFIRRALAKRHAAAPDAAPPPKRSSSIGGMLNIAGASTRPPPRPSYAIGPDNVGYARLSGLGWGGGGLGRPLDGSPGSSRPRTATPEGSARSRSRSPGARASLEPLSAADELNLEQLEDEEGRPSGPGRTEPVATALKLDRRGLGSGKAAKKVTHTAAEIRRAQRRAGREKGERAHAAKSKVKWAQKDKKEREERKRLLAALNA